MRCEHPACTGHHSKTLPWATMCPAAKDQHLERKRAYYRLDAGRQNAKRWERYSATT